MSATVALALSLAMLPLSAQGATVGSSAPGEVPQITEFEVAPSSEQAGANVELNVFLRMCDPDNQARDSVRIVSATNTAPIVITTSQAHGRQTGDVVQVARVRGNTAANSRYWTITVSSPQSFSLDGSAGNGAYVPGTGVVTFSRYFGCTVEQLQANTLIKQSTVSFPPGLRTDPAAVTPCPTALWLDSSCPSESVVGSLQLMAIFLGGLAPNQGPIPITTPIYQVEAPPSEPGRLGTARLPADPPGPLPITLSVRPDGGIDATIDNLPSSAGFAIKIFTIEATLCRLAPCDPATHQALPGASPYVFNPTACVPATSGIVASPWPHPTLPPPGPPSHAESTFTPTGCTVPPPNCRPKKAKARGRGAQDRKKPKRCRDRDRDGDRDRDRDDDD